MDRHSPSASTDRGFSALAFLAAFALVSLFASGPALAANRLAFQDFESDGWQTQFVNAEDWADHVARTTHDPYSGSYSLRWNQDENRVDPITGLQGEGNTALDWRGGLNIVPLCPNGGFFRMSFRHDDYNNDTPASARKLGYIVDDYYTTNGPHPYYGLYIGRQFGNQGVKMSGNAGVPDHMCAAIWGSSTMWTSSPNISPGLNGEWVVFDLYIDYNDNYAQMWMNGNILYPTNPFYLENYPELAAEGKILLPQHPHSDAWRIRGYDVCYYDATRDCVDGCNDQTEYASGIQIDNLEFWDGIPGNEGDVDNPPAIQVLTPVPGGEDYPIPDSVGTLVITGTANDDHGIAEITWSNDRTSESGQVTNQSGNWRNWQLQGIGLETGVNTIEIRVRDTSNQITTETITVTREWEYPAQPESPRIP